MRFYDCEFLQTTEDEQKKSCFVINCIVCSNSMCKFAYWLWALLWIFFFRYEFKLFSLVTKCVFAFWNSIKFTLIKKPFEMRGKKSNTTHAVDWAMRQRATQSTSIQLHHNQFHIEYYAKKYDKNVLTQLSWNEISERNKKQSKTSRKTNKSGEKNPQNLIEI